RILLGLHLAVPSSSEGVSSSSSPGSSRWWVAYSGRARSSAGLMERTRGSESKLWRGGGQLVAHSSERPQPHGSLTLTGSDLRVIHTFHMNGSIETPSRNAPNVETWLRSVKPSQAP